MSLNLKSKIIKAAMLLAVMLLFFGIYQIFVYDGKAKGCSGEHFQKYRDTMATEQIILIINKECAGYRTTYKNWKYVALGSVVVFVGSGFYHVAKQK